ncbi:MAG: hypothetical protein U0414_35830 [Polyangiaceae bacterium]
MRAPWLFVGLILAGCGSASTPPTTDITADSTAPPAASSPPRRAALDVSVVLVAATLADDCGGDAGARPAPVLSKGDSAESEKSAKAKRRCEQTSMQLSITSDKGNVPARLIVKKVELFDASSRSVGVLASSDPTVWDESGGYVPWDERIAPASALAVSYALGQPPFEPDDARDQTYTLKAVVSVDGVDRSITKEVVLSTHANRPALIKT